MRVKNKIFVIYAIPFVLATVLGLVLLSDAWTQYHQAINVRDGINNSSTLSTLVHELQRERGQSAGYIGASGNAFQDTIGQRRNATDMAFKALMESAPDFQAQPLHQKIRDMRLRVDQLTVPVGDMAKVYTQVITTLIHEIEATLSLSQQRSLNDQTRSLLALIRAKEAAGVERAMGANGFSSGGFQPPIYRRFLSLRAEQNLLFALSKQFSNASQRNSLEQLFNAPESIEVERLRSIADQSIYSGNIAGITGANWFAGSTRRIDAIKAIEDRHAHQLHILADAHRVNALQRVSIAATVIIVMLVISIALALRMSRDLVRQIDHIGKTIRAIVSRDENIRVVGRNRRDEFGQMARTLLECRKTLQDADAQQEKFAQDLKTVVTALGDGMARLCDGDYRATITQTFPEGFEALQQDFNKTIEKIRIANEARERQAVEQEEIVSTLAENLKELADGKLSGSIKANFPEEYATLKTDYNSAISQLCKIVTGISETVSTIRERCLEVGAATEELSKRTEGQAATLEQTAASLDEVTATVEQTSKSVQAANNIVEEVQKEADESGLIVNQAVEAMGHIADSSKQISQIISVIDDISFQTSLLALNAGVEAARAGTAGRGFAVVAQEVRGLAQRSADAAKEIKALISTSTEQVETGVCLVGKADGVIRENLDRFQKINEVISGIAVASTEQSTGLAQVNSAINSIDQVTQQNAAMAEETTASSQALIGDAEDLLREVYHFDVGDNRRIGLEDLRRYPSERRSNPIYGMMKNGTFKPSLNTESSPALASTQAVLNTAKSESEQWEDF